jgi:NDP-sugar pyrophosphorylase family protein
MKLPVAILAGGLATRLRPLTENTPKCILEVAGKPFVIHQLELLARHGIRKVVFCLGYKGEKVVKVLREGQQFGVAIDYVFDGPKQLGTAGALKKAVSYLGDAFLVLYGDSYLDIGYQEVVNAFLRSDRSGLMTVFRNSNQWDSSNVVYSDGMVHRYDKVNRSPDMQYIDYGLGALHSAVLSSYPDDEPLDLVNVYKDLIRTNQLAGFEVTTRFYEIGSISGLRETHEYLTRKNGAS